MQFLMLYFHGGKKHYTLFMQMQNKGTGEVNNTFPFMLLEFDVNGVILDNSEMGSLKCWGDIRSGAK